MFHDREDAARQLAQLLKKHVLRQPLVLAIPRGGVVTGAVIARELHADLDVVLSRKLRAPDQPELAIGAIAEDGQIYLNPYARELNLSDEYLDQERSKQLAEIERRQKLFRSVMPTASMTGRSIILTDDGIATGSTMIAALQVVQAQQPHEIIVAVPVAPPDRIVEIQSLCNKVICLQQPEYFMAVGQFYENFKQVEDEQVVEMLRPFVRPNGSSEVRK